MMDEPVPYHVADFRVRWEKRAFRLKTRRVVESDRRARDVLGRWAQRWADRNGHILQPEMEVFDLSDQGENFIRGLVVLGVAWRYIEGARALLGDRALVVEPGVNVLRVPYLTEEDKARQTAWLVAQAATDDEETDFG